MLGRNELSWIASKSFLLEWGIYLIKNTLAVNSEKEESNVIPEICQHGFAFRQHKHNHKLQPP